MEQLCPGCGLVPASECRQCPLLGADRVPQGASGACGSGDPLPPQPPLEAPPDAPPPSSSPVEFQLEGALGSSTDSNATNWPNDPADPYGRAAGDWARFEYVKEVAPPLNPVVGPLPSVPTQGDDTSEAPPGGPQHRCPTCGAPFQPGAADGAPQAPSAAVPPALPVGAQ